MLLFLALSALAAAAVGSVVIYQRGAQQRLAAPDGMARLPPKGVPGERPEPTLETLQPGDVVLDGTEDYVVAGTLTYREERETWAVHALDGGSARRFLEVRRRGGALQAAVLESVDDAPLFGQLGAGLTFRGRALTLEARGDARTVVHGAVDGRSAGLLRYARYAGAGGALLVVEEEGASKRALFGHITPTSTITIYPGS
jgi:hypothetical protein